MNLSVLNISLSKFPSALRSLLYMLAAPCAFMNENGIEPVLHTSPPFQDALTLSDAPFRIQEVPVPPRFSSLGLILPRFLLNFLCLASYSLTPLAQPFA